MATMTLKQLEKQKSIDKLIFHSLDLALYNVSAIVSGEEYMITDNKKKRIVSHNIVSLQKQFQQVHATSRVLRQQSAYDEMIGGAPKINNEMEVSLGDNQLY